MFTSNFITDRMWLKEPISSTSLPGITYSTRQVSFYPERCVIEDLPPVPDRRRRFTFIPRGPPIHRRDAPFVDGKLPRDNRASVEDSPEVQERVLRSPAVLQRDGNAAKPDDYDDGRCWRHGCGLALYDGARGFGTLRTFLTSIPRRKTWILNN